MWRGLSTTLEDGTVSGGHFQTTKMPHCISCEIPFKTCVLLSLMIICNVKVSDLSNISLPCHHWHQQVRGVHRVQAYPRKRGRTKGLIGKVQLLDIIAMFSLCKKQHQLTRAPSLPWLPSGPLWPASPYGNRERQQVRQTDRWTWIKMNCVEAGHRNRRLIGLQLAEQRTKLSREWVCKSMVTIVKCGKIVLAMFNTVCGA